MNSQSTIARAGPLLAGVGLSAFTSGAIASLSLIAVPAILSNVINAALLTTWRHTLDNGVRVCPSLAIAATLTHALTAYINRNSPSGRAKYSIFAAVSTIAIVPFTIFFMSATNDQLFKKESAAVGTTGGVEASSVELVKKWGRLNLTRSVLPAAGAVIAFFAF